MTDKKELSHSTRNTLINELNLIGDKLYDKSYMPFSIAGIRDEMNRLIDWNDVTTVINTHLIKWIEIKKENNDA